jgi:integrase
MTPNNGVSKSLAKKRTRRDFIERQGFWHVARQAEISLSLRVKISISIYVIGKAMGNKRKELGALAVSQINRRGINFVGGVAGLGINVTQTGSRSWILRYQVAGVRKDMGLGGYPDITLAQAKEQARLARIKLAQGIDPVSHNRAARRKMVAEIAAAVTFKDAAKRYIDSQESTWQNDKHVQQWRNTIESYATPKIGQLPVKDIVLTDVLSVLEPIWHTKTETASRLRGRVESIIDWAIAKGYRIESNPARWKGLLDKILPAPGKITKVDHHRALPYKELPSFMLQLTEQHGMGARALEFAILTGCRSGEVRGGTWDEFDLAGAIWTIPAIRMKAKKEHRVPLSPRALQIVWELEKTAFCEFVFPSPHQPKAGSSKSAPLSDMTLAAVLRRMNVPAVPHGFRSTFRDWCAEQTDYPNEVAEMALAHTIGNKVEAAYRRGDLFEKRRQLMLDWENYAFSNRA